METKHREIKQEEAEKAWKDKFHKRCDEFFFRESRTIGSDDKGAREFSYKNGYIEGQQDFKSALAKQYQKDIDFLNDEIPNLSPEEAERAQWKIYGIEVAFEQLNKVKPLHP